jgi:hypothetical protein
MSIIGNKKRTASLSRQDFEDLGGKELPIELFRARIFHLEGLSAELALALRDVLDLFAPPTIINDGLGESEISCVIRGRDALSEATRLLIDYKKSR